jgi:flagellin
MSDIMIGAAARASLISLQQITNDMTRVHKRLATGNRINSPIDGPASYFTASDLRARAAALNGLMDGIFSAERTIEAANNAIAAIETLLNSAKSVALEALQTPVTFVTITGSRSGMTLSTQIASGSGSLTRFEAGDQVTVSDGTTTATYTAVNGDDVDDFLDAINNTANLQVEASLDSDGRIVLEATSNVDVTIAATMDGSGGATLDSVLGLTEGTTEFEPNTTRQSLAQQFDTLLDQIDQMAQDAGYNGVNLLAGGDLSVIFNETGTSKLTMAGGDFAAADLGVNPSSDEFQLDSAIDSAVAAVEAALTTIETQSTVFEANAAVISARQDFTENLSATLTSGADDLVLSDPNEDVAMLLALQTRQQLAATVLSLVNSEEQNALRLFQ